MTGKIRWGHRCAALLLAAVTLAAGRLRAGRGILSARGEQSAGRKHGGVYGQHDAV